MKIKHIVLALVLLFFSSLIAEENLIINEESGEHSFEFGKSSSPNYTLGVTTYLMESRLFTLDFMLNELKDPRLKDAKVYILLKDEKGLIHTHLLYTVSVYGPIFMLDDNYLKCGEGSTVTIYSDDSYVPFLPAHLPNGKYDLQVVLTHSALSEPVYSNVLSVSIPFPCK